MNMTRLLTTHMIVAASAVAMASQTSAPLGKLGQTLEPANIYSRASTRSRVYYSAKPYEYIIIRPAKSSDWLSVVMSNGVLGYVKLDKVARLPYDVTRESVQQPSAPASSGALSKSTIGNYGLKYTGTPYVWGGNDLKDGIDCSGFVKQLFGKIGINLPRTASEQALVGAPVSRYEDLQSGDRLYFWENKRGKIGHTGIYLGNGYFVHSSRGHNGVATDFLTEKWRKILVAARR